MESGNPAVPDEVFRVKWEVEEDLLRLPGVVGVGVGVKEVGRRPTDALAIRVYVTNKRPLNEVPTKQRIPPAIQGIPTDVIQASFELLGLAQAERRAERKMSATAPDPKGEFDPLIGGISIGPCRLIGIRKYSGTLGSVVVGSDGKPVMLSNYHVLCYNSGWKLGNDIAQPGVEDQNPIYLCSSYDAASLQNGALRSGDSRPLGSGGTPGVDTAIASKLLRDFRWEVNGVGTVNGVYIVDQTTGKDKKLPVRKSGKTTDLTYGYLADLDFTITLSYPDGTVTLYHQLVITPTPGPGKDPVFADEGDSGSVVVDDSNQVVGLLFAKFSIGDTAYGVANPISAVTKAMGVTIPNSAPGFWISNQVNLDNKPVMGAPSIADCGELLGVAWTAPDDQAVMVSVFDLDINGDPRWRTEFGYLVSAIAGPAIAYTPSHELVVAFIGKDHRIRLLAGSYGPPDWTWHADLVETAQTSLVSPALVHNRVDHRFALAWAGMDNQHTLNTYSIAEGDVHDVPRWNPRKWDQYTLYSPGLTVGPTGRYAVSLRRIDNSYLNLMFSEDIRQPNYQLVTLPLPVNDHPIWVVAEGDERLLWAGPDEGYGDGHLNSLSGAWVDRKPPYPPADRIVYDQRSAGAPSAVRWAAQDKTYMCWAGAGKNHTLNIARIYQS